MTKIDDDILTASYFFDLANFAHKDLFFKDHPVWDALKNIAAYLKTCVLGKIEVTLPPGVFLQNPEMISIGMESVVESGAYIQGPCVIGKNCQIRHGAYIRGNVIVGDGAVVGHTTEVKNAVFLDHAQAGHFAYIGDSILGNRVNLGAGVKCANLKLDHGNISITPEGGEERIDTDLRKFGAIIGDGAQLGCNSVTNPGTLIGKKTLVYPCVNVGGFIPANHVVKPAHKPLVIEPHK